MLVISLPQSGWNPINQFLISIPAALRDTPRGNRSNEGFTGPLQQWFRWGPNVQEEGEGLHQRTNVPIRRIALTESICHYIEFGLIVPGPRDLLQPNRFASTSLR